MNIRATRILAFAALAVASTSYAGDLSPKDAQFVTKAAIAGMSEVEQSKLAVERSANPKIKSYADMMVSDHGSANRKLMKLAQDNGWKLPDALDAEAKAKVDTLAQAQGEAFDRQYVSNMKTDHDGAVALFREAAKNSDEAALRGFATDTLPTLEQHRKQSGELPPAARRN
jgi:putative membrane protein